MDYQYKKFTQYYDEIVRGNGYSLDDEVNLIDECIQKFGNFGKNILEFACGTGVVGKGLKESGYDVFGVDLSEEMLKKAKINLGTKNVAHGDMCALDLGKQFDLVLCNYNSICHLTRWEQWQAFFANAYKHLNTGGILIFDINTIWEFENITRDFAQFYNVGEDTVCLEMKKNNENYEWNVKMFVKNDSETYDCFQEIIPEQSFHISKIEKELEKAGFSNLHQEDFHKGVVDTESERVYFIARKI